MPLLCGGTTEEKDATDEVQKICDEVGVFWEFGGGFLEFTACTYLGTRCRLNVPFRYSFRVPPKQQGMMQFSTSFYQSVYSPCPDPDSTGKQPTFSPGVYGVEQKMAICTIDDIIRADWHKVSCDWLKCHVVLNCRYI